MAYLPVRSVEVATWSWMTKAINMVVWIVLLSGGLEEINLGILRAFGYFIALVILVMGVITLPIGLIFIIPAIIMMWFLHKGGQVTKMKKEIERIRKIEEDNQKLKLEKMRQDAMKGWGE